jgi:hypothetical protein
MLTDQQQRFMTRMRELAVQQLDLLDQIDREVALYNAEGFGAAITDVALAATDGFEHYTQSDLWNVVTAFDAVQDALGDNVSGQQVNLIKFRG